MSRVPLSILDLAPISEGSTATQALHNSVDLAQHAEAWGFKRFWVAEHHFVAVASASPTVLIGQLLAATKTIRVGSAAVQAGQTTAASIVENFGVLDAFHPGRVDLGLGRSVQKIAESTQPPPAAQRAAATSDTVVDGLLIPAAPDLSSVIRADRLAAMAAAITQEGAKAPDFGDQLADVLALLHGTYKNSGIALHAVPGENAQVDVWVFGSSKGQSARVAGALGLPFVANYHVSPSTTLEAVEAYRHAFVPSSRLAEPYLVVSADVVVAETDSSAAELASSFGRWVYAIRSGLGAPPYPDPAHAKPLTDHEAALVADRTSTQFVGAPAAVLARLDALQKVTSADELLITSVTHDHTDRLRSHELLARAWGLT